MCNVVLPPDRLRAFHLQMRKTLLENITELVAVLTQARHVHLPKLAEKLDRDGSEESRVRRMTGTFSVRLVYFGLHCRRDKKV